MQLKISKVLGTLKFNFLLIYRNVFAREQFYRFNQLLFEASIKGMGILNYENSNVSGEDHLITVTLKNAVQKNNPVFFDVGANVGGYSEALKNSFPAAIIYAFEPHPKNFEALRLKALEHVIINNSAVGEKPGELTLYDRADFDGSSHASLYSEVITDLHHQETTESQVAVITLDEFCEEHHITEIDYLKIDTEGNEFSVLKGATRLLVENRIRYIHLEFNEMNVASGVHFRDIRKLLSNYDLYRLLPKGMVKVSESPLFSELYAFQNIVAIPLDQEQQGANTSE
ncbi:FkbM family methyltransferase [Luteolibacter sp. AS25]|uniref:FkbM family methyltransferase n=1 Tax=Luteolibacter sp. AS25 TaxID=3135776 RepID=UPI00398BBAC6